MAVSIQLFGICSSFKVKGAELDAVHETPNGLVDAFTLLFKDTSTDLRTGIHRMLQECRVATSSGLRDMILSLLDNMRRFPGDTKSIWR